MTTPLPNPMFMTQLGTLGYTDTQMRQYAADETQHLTASLQAMTAERDAAKADAERLSRLDKQGYAYGFEDMHEGNKWEIEGPFMSLRVAPVQAQERKPLTDEQIEKLREKTFSTNNPYCPVDSKSMRKAARATEAAHGINGASL